MKDHKVDLEHQRLDDPVKTVINKLREKIRQLEEEVDALIHRERENVL